MERRSRLFYRTRAGRGRFSAAIPPPRPPSDDPPLIIPRKRLNIRHVLPNWRRAGLAPLKCVITRRRAGRRFPPVAATIKASENAENALSLASPRFASPRASPLALTPALNLIRVRRRCRRAWNKKGERRKEKERGNAPPCRLRNPAPQVDRAGVKLRGHCCSPLCHWTWRKTV